MNRLTLIDKFLFCTLVVPSIFLISLFFLIDGFYINELLANLFAFFSVILIWLIFYKVFNKYISIKILNIILLLMLLRISVNFFHIYFFQLPISGYVFSSEIDQFFGDSGLIHERTLMYLDYADNFYEIIFNEAHLLNNKGQLIIYGIIYNVYGPFPSTLVPWDTLVVGFYSCTFYLLSKAIFKNENCEYVPYLVFLMPVFTIYPLLYRDYYIILCIGLTSLIVLSFNDNLDFKKYFYLIILSVFLYQLRKVYVILPMLFLYTFYFVKFSNFRKYLIYIFIITIFVLSFYIFYNKDLIFISSAKRSEIYHSTLYFNKILELLQYTYMIVFEAEHEGGNLSKYFEEQIFPIKMAFRSMTLLLSPFPWTNKIPSSHSVYQILLYIQTLFTFIVFYRICDLIKLKFFNKNFFVILCFYFYIFILAAFGAQQLSSLYVLISLPLLVTSFINFNIQEFKKYALFSVLFIIIVHIVYTITKSIVL